MGLFKKNLIFFILFSFFFCFTNNQNKIKQLSILDYSPLSSHEFQFGFGFQNNNIYTSIDKMISQNLIGSFKLFKLNSSDIELFNQNTLLFSSDKTQLNFIITINYLINHSEVDRWLNSGIIFDLLDENKRFIPSLGAYYDFFDIEDLSNNRLNYFFNIKSKINNSYSFIMSSSFNSFNKIINYNMEINLEI